MVFISKSEEVTTEAQASFWQLGPQGEGLALVGEQSSLCFVALPLAAVQSDVVKEGCKQMKFKAKPDSGFKTATGFSMKTGLVDHEAACLRCLSAPRRTVWAVI